MKSRERVVQANKTSQIKYVFDYTIWLKQRTVVDILQIIDFHEAWLA